MNTEQKSKQGKQWADILMLKRSREYNDRYLTSWGDKTALGVYLTIKRLVEEAE